MEAGQRDLRIPVSEVQAGTLFEVRHRALLERAEEQFRSSAALLRSRGRLETARQVERFAEHARLQLEEPRMARLANGWFREDFGSARLLDGVLDFALEVLHADKGNLQLADPVTGALSIAAHRGFGTEFLDYFAVVNDDASACGRAAQRGAQVMITDVRADPDFGPHLDIAAASGFRAVQSTPLIAADGRLVGILSTHYPRPTTLPSRDLLTMRRFGALIGDRVTAGP